MAVGEIGTSGALGRTRAQAALTDVFAGLVCSILSIAYCLSYAALIFNGPLGPALAYGVAVTFLSAAIGGSIVAWRSSLPFAVAGPDSSISVVLAALVATVIQRLGNVDPLVPTLIAISAATALTGLLLCILGFTHAGRAIRFVPFPVIGGFLGATGWLMMAGAVQVVTEQKLLLANLVEFANIPMLGKIAAAIVVAVSSASVACTSTAEILPVQRARRASIHSRLNNSRPVDFGGRAPKNGSARQTSSSARLTTPLAAHRPPSS